MKRLLPLISISIVLVACQSGDEPDNNSQVDQLTEQVQKQNEQIETLQEELDEKTRELQQLQQEESPTSNESQTDEEQPNESDQSGRTTNFHLQTPEIGDQISDTFSIQGMIRYEAIGSIRIELTDAAGETVEDVPIEEDWFNETPSEREWTGFELNLTLTSSMASGEGQVVVHDNQAEEEVIVPVQIK